METRNLAELYDLAPVDWSGVAAALDAGFPQAPGSGGPDRHTCWLVTIDPDGRPHVNGIGAVCAASPAGPANGGGSQMAAVQSVTRSVGDERARDPQDPPRRRLGMHGMPCHRRSR